VGTLGVSDANPLPALAGAHQGRVNELQAAPLIEEARDELVRRRSSKKLRSMRFVSGVTTWSEPLHGDPHASEAW
jgi:hypothetical protein